MVSRQDVNKHIRESLGLTPKHAATPTLPVEGHLCDFPFWSYSKKRASVTSLHVDYEDGTYCTVRAPEGVLGPRFPGYLDVLLFFGYRDLTIDDYVELSMYTMLKTLGLDPTSRRNLQHLRRDMDKAFTLSIKTKQSFISAGMGHDEQLLHQHWQEVETDLGADDGVLMVDGSDFPKQGVHSVGVKRQYCGELGKRANCQAGVFVGYVSPQGYTLLDRRLYVPVEWLTDDAYAERRRQCGIPTEITFKTKPALAQEMLAAVVKTQRLRCRWVVADEAFGANPGFLKGVGGLGLWYFAEAPTPRGCGSRVWSPTSPGGLSKRAVKTASNCWGWVIMKSGVGQDGIII